MTKVRYRTNMENNQFVTDTELAIYLNDSLAEMDDLLIATYEDYKMKWVETNISTPVVDLNYFTLPADFLKARGVDRQMSGRWISLDRYGFAKRNQYSSSLIGALYYYNEIMYHIQDGYCYVIPAQNSAANYKLFYVPRYQTLATTDNLPDYMDQQAWHEYAVTDSSIKVLQKQDLDTTVLMAQKQALEMRIINAAKPRDAGPPKTVQNTRYDNEWDLWGFTR